MRDALLEMLDHFGRGRRHDGLPAEHLRSIYDFISEFVKRNRVPLGARVAAARALPTRTMCEDLDAAVQEVRASSTSLRFVSGSAVQDVLAALLELLGGSDGFDVSDQERDAAACAFDATYQYTRWRAYLERLIEREW
jgi:hypothetical protein